MTDPKSGPSFIVYDGGRGKVKDPNQIRVIEMMEKYQDISTCYQLKWDLNEVRRDQNLPVAEKVTELVLEFFNLLKDQPEEIQMQWVGAEISCLPLPMEKNDDVFILKIERSKVNIPLSLKIRQRVERFLQVGKPKDSMFNADRISELQIDRSTNIVTQTR